MPNYKVLETDYSSYSIVYDCAYIKEYLWILTREAVIDDDMYDELVTKSMELLPMYNFDKQLD